MHFLPLNTHGFCSIALSYTVRKLIQISAIYCNMNCSGKHDSTWNIPRSITFSSRKFGFPLGQCILETFALKLELKIKTVEDFFKNNQKMAKDRNCFLFFNLLMFCNGIFPCEEWKNLITIFKFLKFESANTFKNIFSALL